MKTILLVACIMLSGLMSAAQDKEKLVGKWRLVNFETEDMYYDIIKDSLHFSPQYGDDQVTKEQMDASTRKLQAEMKEMCSSAFFEFKPGMAYTKGFGMPLETITGIYSVDETLKTISFKPGKTTGELKKEDLVKYQFNKNRLTFIISDEDGGFKLEFEKE